MADLSPVQPFSFFIFLDGPFWFMGTKSAVCHCLLCLPVRIRMVVYCLFFCEKNCLFVNYHQQHSKNTKDNKTISKPLNHLANTTSFLDKCEQRMLGNES
jgi:hypothetical protein